MEAHVRDEEDERAHGLRRRARGAKEPAPPPRPEEQHHPDEVAEEARPHHLPHRIVAREVLREGVHRGDEACPEHHEGDGDERLPSDRDDHCGASARGSLGRRQSTASKKMGVVARYLVPRAGRAGERALGEDSPRTHRRQHRRLAGSAAVRDRGPHAGRRDRLRPAGPGRARRRVRRAVRAVRGRRIPRDQHHLLLQGAGGGARRDREPPRPRDRRGQHDRVHGGRPARIQYRSHRLHHGLADPVRSGEARRRVPSGRGRGRAGGGLRARGARGDGHPALRPRPRAGRESRGGPAGGPSRNRGDRFRGSEGSRERRARHRQLLSGRDGRPRRNAAPARPHGGGGMGLRRGSTRRSTPASSPMPRLPASRP